MTYERLRWQLSSLPGESAPRAAQPYRAAIAPEIADVRDVPLSPATCALVTEAATEIARFDHRIGVDPLHVSAALRRAEVGASSQIENVIASARLSAWLSSETGADADSTRASGLATRWQRAAAESWS